MQGRDMEEQENVQDKNKIRDKKKTKQDQNKSTIPHKKNLLPHFYLTVFFLFLSLLTNPPLLAHCHILTFGNFFRVSLIHPLPCPLSLCCLSQTIQLTLLFSEIYPLCISLSLSSFSKDVIRCLFNQLFDVS